jgi:hypothetical protein
MRKVQITIQLDPAIIDIVEKFAVNQGLAKQVAYEHVLLMGIAQITRETGSSILKKEGI